MRLYKKLSLIVLFLILVPMSLMSFFFFFSSERYIKNEILSNLNSIADLKVEKIKTYFTERKDDLLILSRRNVIRGCLPVLDHLRFTQNRPDYQNSKDILDQQLGYSLEASDHYNDISLLGKDGKIVYSTNANVHANQFNQPLLINSKDIFKEAQHNLYVSDIYKKIGPGARYYICFAAPVVDTSDAFMGVVAIELDLKVLYDFIQSTTGLGASGETLLLEKRENNKIIFLNKLRHDPTPPLSKTIQLGEAVALPAQRSILGENGSGIGIDYRGQKVLAAWRHINSRPWGLVTKIDLSEALIPIQRLSVIMFLIFLAAFITTILIVIYAARSITEPIQKLKRGAEIIGLGQLDYRLKIHSTDEIGDLANTFNKMTSDLRQSTTSVKIYTTEIEARKKAEEKLKEALAIKSEFISLMSHELRTPLFAISEGLNIVLEGLAGKVNDQQNEILETARKDALRLSRLINNILNMQKLEAGRMELDLNSNDVKDTISEAAEIMGIPVKQKGLNLTVEIQANPSEAWFDKDAIIQVLTNLIGNAVKFTNTGTINIKAIKDKNFIHVMVQDTGKGIKSEDISRLFRKFERSSDATDKKQEGTGLGLAICRGIIELHNGDIWIESIYGAGTTIHFTLPINKI